VVIGAVAVGALLGVGLAYATHGTKSDHGAESNDRGNGIGDDNELAPPPAASKYGTPAEIGTRGDAGNAGALYHGDYPSDSATQERAIGGGPARFSGYTTWVESVRRVPAHLLVPVYPGDYLRVRVKVFNRDTEQQHVCACDFLIWSRAAGEREADAVPVPSFAPDTEMASGQTLTGDVYLYAGAVRGPLFIVYAPDHHVPFAMSASTGVWRLPGAA